MREPSARLRHVLRHPLAFAARVLRAFHANRGLLLAGAVAYYALLSIVPMLILLLIGLSGIVDQHALLVTLGRYLGWLVPGQSGTLLADLSRFLEHRELAGWVSLATMVFFSSMAFSVLQTAMSMIFRHHPVGGRHYLVAAVIPYCCILFLGAGLLLMTLVSGTIEVIGSASIEIAGHRGSLHGASGLLLYLLGVGGEVFVLAAIYLVMPASTPSWRHALIGALAATFCWEVTRRVLVWYFATLSQADVVYGSLATAIVLLTSLDIAASLLLFGAQVIAEYERLAVPGPGGS